MGARRRAVTRHAVLWAILLIAVVVRLWGIDFGLPNVRCRPDEGVAVKIALRFFGGDFHPHFFRWPTLYMYLLHAIFRIHYLLLHWFGGSPSLAAYVGAAWADPAPLYLLARVVTAAIGVATVAVTARLGTAVAGGRVGRLAGFFLALAYLHVRSSHFAVTDVPMTFFLACSMLFVVRAAEGKGVRAACVAGAFAWLAASTKYVGVLMLAPMVVAAATRARLEVAADRSPGATGRAVRSMVAAIAAFAACLAVAFVLGSPYVVLDFPLFLKEVRLEAVALEGGHFAIQHCGWTYHFARSLGIGAGWPLLAAGLAGMALLARSRTRTTLGLLVFQLVYYVIAGDSSTTFVRYMLPLLPFLCVAAAYAVAGTVEWLCDRMGRPAATWWYGVAGVVVMLPSLADAVVSDHLLAQTDTRAAAREWIDQHVASGSSIGQAITRKWATVALPPPPGKLERKLAAAQRTGDASSVQHLEVQADESGGRGVPKLDEWRWNRVTGWFKGRRKDELPDWIVTATSAIPHFTDAPPEALDRIREHYEDAAEFIGAASAAAGFYDEQDAFFLPFAGFEGVAHPGPNLTIWRRMGS